MATASDGCLWNSLVLFNRVGSKNETGSMSSLFIFSIFIKCFIKMGLVLKFCEHDFLISNIIWMPLSLSLSLHFSLKDLLYNYQLLRRLSMNVLMLNSVKHNRDNHRRAIRVNARFTFNIKLRSNFNIIVHVDSWFFVIVVGGTVGCLSWMYNWPSLGNQ